jgi:phosphate transport system substrate-binding protein
MTTRKVCVAVTAALALSVAGAGAAQAKTITMSGSTSIAPLANKLARAFVKKNDGTKFVILEGGSDVGITDASRGRVTLGMSSRDPKPADPGGIVFNKFARDGVCIVTNTSNPIPSLSQKQVQDIFSGRVRNWSQVPGARANGPIDLISRTPASGTQDAFQNIFMGESLRVAGSADPQNSNGQLEEEVFQNDNAIGYASLNFTDRVNNVPYAGVPCNLRTAKSGEYGGVRNFYFVSRGKAKGPAKKFIKFSRSDKKAQKIIARDWVPLK